MWIKCRQGQSFWNFQRQAHSHIQDLTTSCHLAQAFSTHPCLPLKGTLAIPLSHSGHPGSSPIKSLIPAVESFLLHKATQSQGPEITIRSSWELSFHHEGVWKGFVPVLRLGELRGQW